MFEIIAGLIVGASATIMGLHFSGRLTPIQAAETTYSGFSATSVSANGAAPYSLEDELRILRNGQTQI